MMILTKKSILGIILLPIGGFFLIQPVNDFISHLVSFNIEQIEAVEAKSSKNKYWGFIKSVNQAFLNFSDVKRFMFAFVLIVLFAFTTPDFQQIFTGTVSQPATSSNIKNNSIKAENPQILKVSPSIVENVKYFLNDGFELTDANKVYYTKSKDFNNVYFYGALVIKDTQIEPCIWVSNNKDFTNIMSANEGALLATPVPDASKSDAHTSPYDDGYSRINTQLLSDKASLLNTIQKNRENRN